MCCYNQLKEATTAKILFEYAKYHCADFKSTSRSLSERIVSISRLNVRPVGGGNASASTEFGAKISASICSDGFISPDRLDFTPYAEASGRTGVHAIEGKFGQAKRRLGLSRVTTRPKETGESAIATSFVVINLTKFPELFFLFIFWLGHLAYIFFRTEIQRAHETPTVFITRLNKRKSELILQIVKA